MIGNGFEREPVGEGECFICDCERKIEMKSPCCGESVLKQSVTMNIDPPTPSPEQEKPNFFSNVFGFKSKDKRFEDFCKKISNPSRSIVDLDHFYSKYKFDLNRTDDRNGTPLGYAVNCNRTDITEWLINKGADPNVKGNLNALKWIELIYSFG